MTKDRFRLKRTAVLALFCAIAYVAVCAVRISGIGGFLSFDIKDTVITLASMLFGPLAGVVISFIVSLLESISVSSTGPWGALMNFASSAIFSATAGGIYNYFPAIRKKPSGALTGLVSAVLLCTASMVVLNVVVTPLYLMIERKNVLDMILPLILPFNLIKTTLNAALVIMMYKPISVTLKRSGVTEYDAEAKYSLKGKNIAIIAVTALVAVAGVLLLIFVFHGKFTVKPPEFKWRFK